MKKGIQSSSVNFPYREKSSGIAAALRRSISTGELGRGERLPTRRVLLDAYGVTSGTLQRALDELIADGFVTSAGRRGTFVSDSPPHLTNYALLFPNRFLPQAPVNRFFHSLYQASQHLGGGRTMKVCDGFTGRAGFLEYENLIEDMQQNRLAGLIFASAPWALDGTPLVAADGLPRTAIMSQPRYPHIPVVWGDEAAFFQMAAERLYALGCRRVAVLLSARSQDELVTVRRILGQYDLLPDDDFLLGLSLEHPDWSGRYTRLLFRLPAAQRPDGLLIADDHFTGPVTSAMRSLSDQIGRDLPIITLGNRPWRPDAQVPVIELGYAVPDFLQACIQNIGTLRQGGMPAPLTRIKPTFSDAADTAAPVEITSIPNSTS